MVRLERINTILPVVHIITLSKWVFLVESGYKVMQLKTILAISDPSSLINTSLFGDA